MSKMMETTKLGTQWWNDSCDISELKEAVASGATGATSNPVIVSGVVEGDQERWLPVIDKLVKDMAFATEDEIAWALIERVAVDAAKVLEPVFNQAKGRSGYLSVQVNPKFYRSGKMMAEHGKKLAALAPNIAIKAPSTLAGYEAFEELTASGVNVNCTVSFSLAQVIEAAETIERGLKRAEKDGLDTSEMNPYITIMVGRIDDQLRRQMKTENIVVDPGYTEWGGVSVFKKAYQIFKERGYRPKLLAAAYRNHMQWSELIGVDTLQTIPYGWWKKFDSSNVELKKTIDCPVDDRVVGELSHKFSDFRKVYEEKGMSPAEFESYGASQFTLNQFLEGYQKLLSFIRTRMIGH